MKRARRIVLILVIAVLAAFFGINFYVVGSTAGRIEARVQSDEISLPQAALKKLKGEKADCILVLGAAVKPDGSPTPMLEDRLEVGLYLYRSGAADKLLLSGDNGQVEYNEVKAMREYMLQHGVRGKDIFLDHAGFSTYESLYRARDIFRVSRVIVVTQSYHEYRALYIARSLGLDAVGAAADQRRYGGQTGRDLREIAARDKDFFQCIRQPQPTFLGEEIPISGDGRVTW